jgi:DNA-binding LytR/AlgR family response regulator
VTQALQLKPDVLFFDIRMPGQSGLEAAAELAEAWQADDKPFPALVFITAFDQYAVQAFEAQALDYLLKPVQTQRLEKTVSKVQLELIRRAQEATTSVADSVTKETRLEATLAQLLQLLVAVPNADAVGSVVSSNAPLKHIQASIGNTIHLLPVQAVVYFEAADKYIRVLTTEREYLIRTPLRELLAQIDASAFWQIHRGSVVNADCIDSVTRDEAGKLWLALRGRPERLAVSRLYAHLFKAM